MRTADQITIGHRLTVYLAARTHLNQLAQKSSLLCVPPFERFVPVCGNIVIATASAASWTLVPCAFSSDCGESDWSLRFTIPLAWEMPSLYQS